MTMKIVPGRPNPLGATPDPRGTNFAVASGGDEVTLCLFDADGETQLVLPDRDGDVWHGFVAEVGPGQAYGFRVNGPFDPGRGLRYNSAKLLLDPYARAIDGAVRFGPEVLGHAVENPSAPSPLDSSHHVPRSLVSAPEPTMSAPTPQHDLADTILYEVHVRGFTATHPGVPEDLRGTYAGLAHEAALQHLVDLGVTAVELLPVHHNVPEAFLVERGLTNYWGYNTIGFFAPQANYSAAVRADSPAARSLNSAEWSTRCMVQGWRWCSTSCSTTRRKAERAARPSAIAGSTTPPTTVSIRPTSLSTSTRRGAAIR